MTFNGFVNRELTNKVRQTAEWYPIVSITGPRQSGKSTLIKSIFDDYEYLNLENSQLKDVALDDPVGFIENRPTKLIIDEIQRVPELFSMIQVKSDSVDIPGSYIISASQNFNLLKGIQQSLAGRVGIMRLLPFSYREISASDLTNDPDEVMFKGGYPRLYTTNMLPNNYYRNYISTYIMKDVAGLISRNNAVAFKTFVDVCALHVGNIINLSNISTRVGISRQTAKSWLSLLETSYVTFQLRPFYENKFKTTIKTPKIYFYDTGLLCKLLGVISLEDLLLSKYLGVIFENFIVAETLKNYFNQDIEPDLFFYRDKNGEEVDLIDATNSRNMKAIEIKSSQTHHAKYHNVLNRVSDKLGIIPENRAVVMRVDASYNSKVGKVLSTTDYLQN